MQENNKQENNKKGSVRNMVSYIFESIMSLLYLVLSFILLFTKLSEEAIANKYMRLLLGILLGFYGIFRVYRTIRKFQNKNKENN